MAVEDDMDRRVTRLETHMEYIRRDLDEIKDALKEIRGTLGDVLKVLPTLPTKRDLDLWRWQWVATGAAIIAIILAGMGWLSSRPF